VQLHRDRERFEAAGVRLALIGQGTPAQAREFRDSHKLELEMYVDERRDAYRGAGAKIGTFGELLGPRSVAVGIRRALTDGVRQGRTVGHPAQLGGVLLVRPDASIPYAHLAQNAADNPANDEVLAAARATA
jgi:peroxiredoxin